MHMTLSQRNLSGYDLPVIEWRRVRQTLATDHTQAPGTVQIDGVLYFNSGPRTRKSRNIAGNPQCVLSIATIRFDLVVEGRAVRATDASELGTVVEAFRRNGWPAQVDGDALTAEYSAPSAGPPPWWLFRIEPETVYAFGTDETGGATKDEMGQDE